MRDHIEAFVAFDTSKLRNAVAIAEAGRTGEIRFLGEIDNDGAATGKLVRKLAARYERLTFCYEAGPTGYGLYRQIEGLGYDCMVVAPSLIPKKPGARVKTNRRDAVGLAKLSRADILGERNLHGLLQRVFVQEVGLCLAPQTIVVDLPCYNSGLAASLSSNL